jgi:hypothetical protein
MKTYKDVAGIYLFSRSQNKFSKINPLSLSLSSNNNKNEFSFNNNNKLKTSL